jgi:hypothetical protein
MVCARVGHLICALVTARDLEAVKQGLRGSQVPNADTIAAWYAEMVSTFGDHRRAPS